MQGQERSPLAPGKLKIGLMTQGVAPESQAGMVRVRHPLEVADFRESQSHRLQREGRVREICKIRSWEHRIVTLRWVPQRWRAHTCERERGKESRWREQGHSKTREREQA
ncbi:hypothetical protein FKM82_008517 [Ascaphus truei]